MSETQLITQKDLQAAVKDINQVLSPEPKLKMITTRQGHIENILATLGALVNEAGEWTDERCSNLHPDTVSVYTNLLQNPETPTAATAPAAGDEAECPSFGVAPDTEDPACQTCLRAQECVDAVEAKTVKAKAKKKKEGKKKESYSRIQSVIEVLRTGAPFTRKTLAEEANKLYAQKGGKDNLKESVWSTNHTVTVLHHMDLLESNDDGFALK